MTDLSSSVLELHLHESGVLLLIENLYDLSVLPLAASCGVVILVRIEGCAILHDQYVVLVVLWL